MFKILNKGGKMIRFIFFCLLFIFLLCIIGTQNVNHRREIRELEYQIQVEREDNGTYKMINLRKDLNRYIIAYNELSRKRVGKEK